MPISGTLPLTNDPKYAAKRMEMESLLLAEIKQLHGPYRFWDQPKNQ